MQALGSYFSALNISTSRRKDPDPSDPKSPKSTLRILRTRFALVSNQIQAIQSLYSNMVPVPNL
jgi:hypothetical protein